MSTYERKEWQKSLEKRRVRQVKESARELRQMAQAGTAAEQLTAEPRWNLFLQTVKALDEPDQQALEQVEAAILSPTTVAQETLVTLKISHALLRGRLQARAEVLDIPKKLVEDGRNAREAYRLAQTG
jgi:hypothetical protein